LPRSHGVPLEGQERGGVYGQAATAQKRVEASGGSMLAKLDGRQQAALVKAQLATKDLVAALKIGGDWQSALAEYGKVSVTAARLDA
jgi:hypothetical protein